MRERSQRTSSLWSRMHPCDTAWPRSHGHGVPWTPTTPPPGQSVSFEYALVSKANAPRIGAFGKNFDWT
jgi:hypothetical protein